MTGVELAWEEHVNNLSSRKAASAKQRARGMGVVGLENVLGKIALRKGTDPTDPPPPSEKLPPDVVGASDRSRPANRSNHGSSVTASRQNSSSAWRTHPAPESRFTSPLLPAPPGAQRAPAPNHPPPMAPQCVATARPTTHSKARGKVEVQQARTTRPPLITSNRSNPKFHNSPGSYPYRPLAITRNRPETANSANSRVFSVPSSEGHLPRPSTAVPLPTRDGTQSTRVSKTSPIFTRVPSAPSAPSSPQLVPSPPSAPRLLDGRPDGRPPGPPPEEPPRQNVQPPRQNVLPASSVALSTQPGSPPGSPPPLRAPQGEDEAELSSITGDEKRGEVDSQTEAKVPPGSKEPGLLVKEPGLLGNRRTLSARFKRDRSAPFILGRSSGLPVRAPMSATSKRPEPAAGTVLPAQGRASMGKAHSAKAKMKTGINGRLKIESGMNGRPMSRGGSARRESSGPRSEHALSLDMYASGIASLGVVDEEVAVCTDDEDYWESAGNEGLMGFGMSGPSASRAALRPHSAVKEAASAGISVRPAAAMASHSQTSEEAGVDPSGPAPGQPGGHPPALGPPSPAARLARPEDKARRRGRATGGEGSGWHGTEDGPQATPCSQPQRDGPPTALPPNPAVNWRTSSRQGMENRVGESMGEGRVGERAGERGPGSSSPWLPEKSALPERPATCRTAASTPYERACQEWRQQRTTREEERSSRASREGEQTTNHKAQGEQGDQREQPGSTWEEGGMQLGEGPSVSVGGPNRVHLIRECHAEEGIPSHTLRSTNMGQDAGLEAPPAGASHWQAEERELRRNRALDATEGATDSSMGSQGNDSMGSHRAPKAATDSSQQLAVTDGLTPAEREPTRPAITLSYKIGDPILKEQRRPWTTEGAAQRRPGVRRVRFQEEPCRVVTYDAETYCNDDDDGSAELDRQE